MAEWARSIYNDEIFRVRLCYSNHQRYRVAHEEISGHSFKLMSLARWIKMAVALRNRYSEAITVDSPLLVWMNRGRLVPTTGTFMARMDKVYGPVPK